MLKFIGDGVLASFPIGESGTPAVCDAALRAANAAQAGMDHHNGLCKPLGRSVLVSADVARATTLPLVPLSEHALRGIAQPCPVFAPPGA